MPTASQATYMLEIYFSYTSAEQRVVVINFEYIHVVRTLNVNIMLYCFYRHMELYDVVVISCL